MTSSVRLSSSDTKKTLSTNQPTEDSVPSQSLSVSPLSSPKLSSTLSKRSASHRRPRSSKKLIPPISPPLILPFSSHSDFLATTSTTPPLNISISNYRRRVLSMVRKQLRVTRWFPVIELFGRTSILPLVMLTIRLDWVTGCACHPLLASSSQGNILPQSSSIWKYP